jgi:hypothetical protein
MARQQQEDEEDALAEAEQARLREIARNAATYEELSMLDNGYPIASTSTPTRTSGSSFNTGFGDPAGQAFMSNQHPAALADDDQDMLNGAAAGLDDIEPLYVNAKQYHRILKRRIARERLKELHRLSTSRKVCVVLYHPISRQLAYLSDNSRICTRAGISMLCGDREGQVEGSSNFVLPHWLKH